MESVTIEILPPPVTWKNDKIITYCHQVVNILKKLEVWAINIPEVINETRNGDRGVDFVPKLDNIQFAELLKQYHPNLVIIPYKICVVVEKLEFENWVEGIYKMGIRHLIIVGGEKATNPYPGYTVMEAAQLVKKRFPEIKLGGISIFTRPDETDRILKKIDSGMDFFFSQIIFEAANAKQILLTLHKECKTRQLTPPKIYLSTALASKVRDVEFMKWLGVEFPTAMYRHLLKESDVSVELSSQNVVDMMLDEIFHFLNKEKIDVGFNIEHVMYSNLHLIQSLYEDVKLRIAEI